MTYIDPRGILRKAVAIEEKSNETLVTLECGHVASFNPIFHYRVGDRHHCLRCGQAAREERRD